MFAMHNLCVHSKSYIWQQVGFWLYWSKPRDQENIAQNDTPRWCVTMYFCTGRWQWRLNLDFTRMSGDIEAPSIVSLHASRGLRRCRSQTRRSFSFFLLFLPLFDGMVWREKPKATDACAMTTMLRMRPFLPSSVPTERLESSDADQQFLTDLFGLHVENSIFVFFLDKRYETR